MAATINVLAGQFIQDAIDAADPGDTILVHDGVFAENIVITKSLTLASVNGQAATSIVGQGSTALGTIVIAPGVNDVTIGGLGVGFTIEGIDNVSPGIESGAVYLQGAHNNITIQGNDIVAKGDAGLMSEFAFANTNMVVDSNEFSGQTFSGANPAGDGFGILQFTTPNVPRQLVVLGSNDGGGASSNITFTNNLVSGTAGGTNGNGDPQGNTLVTIDAANSTIANNTFTGFTNRFATQLRAREEDTDIQNNSFSNDAGGNVGTFVENDGVPGTISGNAIEYGNGNDYIFASAGNDSIDGGGGNDTYDVTAAGASGAFVDLASGLSFATATGIDSLANIENVKGSAGNDGLYGDSNANVFVATTGTDVIDARGGSDTFDASAAATAVSANLQTGSVTGAFTATLTSVENIKTGAGNDSIVASSAGNAINAGGGFDTVSYGATNYGDAGTTIGWSAGAFAVATTAGGADAVTGVEKLDFADNDVWLVTNAAEFTSALAGATAGDVIKLAPGDYVGSFTVGMSLTIESATGDAGDVLLKGTFKSANGLANGDSVATFLQTAPSYDLGASATGLTIAANDVTVRNITLTSYQVGIDVGSNQGLILDGVDLDGFVTGVRKGTAAVVTDFTWTGGTLSDGHHGATFNAAASDAGDFSDVLIQGVTFQNLNEKGLYFEQLSDAELLDLIMTNVGQFGRGPAFGGVGPTLGGYGAGIDINLKYESYSDILISGFGFTNVGLSNGGGSPHAFGGAITVKARDDGPSYDSPDAATLDGVTIENGSINGTSTGIRIGEPTQNNAGPTNVTVDNVGISNAVVAEYDNRTQSTLDVTLTNGHDTVTTSSAATGPIHYAGLDGNDNITGGGGNDTIEGGADNDVLDGGAGADQLIGGAGDDTYTIDASDTVVEAADGGTDTIRSHQSYTLADDLENLTLLDFDTGVETFENFVTGPIANGENGWVNNGPGNRDQEVVDLSGNKVFRMSGDPSSGDFGGPYSAALSVSAGEPSTTAEASSHSIKFKFKPVSDTPDSSRLEVDFGRADATDRNNFMVIESSDVTGGIRIAVSEPGLDGNFSLGNNFTPFTGNVTLIDSVDPTVWHEIELRLTYLDGPDNDVIEVYLDGQFIGTTTTFENFRDAPGGAHEAHAEANQTNRLFFRASSNGLPSDPGNQNQGFYFDDISSSIHENASGTGNAAGNVITGNSGDNTLLGLGGEDTVDGGEGHDSIDGGEGADDLSGGGGNDTFVQMLGEGNDTIDGGDGIDTVALTGTSANETVTVGVTGGQLTGFGSTVTDIEHITLDLGTNGATGDTLSYAGTMEAVSVNLATGTATGFSSIAGVENIVGGEAGDTLTGDANANVINGGGGSDQIDGGGGVDTATGYGAGYTLRVQAGHWVVSNDIDTDILSNVEKVTIDGETYVLADNFADGGFDSIQAAIGGADADDIIMVAAGVYDEDLNINKAVTIRGAHAGDVGTDAGREAATGAGETTVIGRSKITASGAVTIDGVRFLNDGTTTGGGPSNPTLQVLSGFNHVITNSIFYSAVNGAVDGVDDRAISFPGIATGNAEISGNYITGAHESGFSGGSWGRGIWFDGGGVNLTIEGNTFEFTRTGVNLDMSGSSTATIVGNTYITNGTAFSVGIDLDGVTFTDNNFDGVSAEFNFRNLTTDIVFDASPAVDGITPVDSALDRVVVYGGTGNDTLRGTEGNDYLDDNAAGSPFESSAAVDNDVLEGRGGDDVLIAEFGNDLIDGGDGNDTMNGGAGDDTLTGGAGDDSVDGGADTDTFVLEKDFGDYTITLNSGTYTIVDNATNDTDTVTNVENFDFNGTVVDVTGNPNTIVSSFGPSIASVLESGTDEDSTASSIAVAEGAAVGTAIATVTAQDVNFAAGEELTFTLVNGGGLPYTGPFTIVENPDGLTAQIQVAGALNFEATDSYAFFVKVADDAGHSVTQAVPVFILNANEAPTDLGLNNLTLDEDTDGAEAVPVGQVSVVDPDAGNSHTFTVDDTRFEVVADGSNYNLQLKVGESVDFETAATIDVKITATDQGGLSYDETFTLNVVDVNESPGGADDQAATMELGSTEVPLNLEAPIDPEGGPVTLTVISLPSEGTVLINGVALVTGRVLTAAEFESLIYTAPLVDSAPGVNTYFLQFTYTDDFNAPLPLTVELEVTDAVNNSYNGDAGANRLDGAAGNDILRGFGNTDLLIGGIGNDTLNGGAGADTMQGGSDNDQYLVDDANDVLIEAAGSGVDRVFAYASYTLTASAEIELFTTGSTAGTDAINLTGNEFGQTIHGNAGDNILSGGGGNDTMYGFSGSDTYFVDNSGDVVFEAVGGGTDTLRTTASYTLAGGVEIELFTTTNAAGTTAINLTGNAFGQSLVGNAGDNALNGSGGADTMTGNGGNDSYFIDNAGDQVIETVGGGSDTARTSVSYGLAAGSQIELLGTTNTAGTTAINLTGNEFGQYIVGNAGNNVLNGGGGNDIIITGGGNDFVLFDTTLGAGNIDTITDFNVANDTIHLDHGTFTALSAGALDPSAFRTGSTALDADDRILFDQGTGALFYDADGTGGGAKIQFATLTAGLALTNADFVVI